MIELVKNRIEEINSLCKELSVDKLWVFGSANSDSFREESDIDFLVSFEELKIEDYAENYFLLAENLEKLFARNIDLVTVKSLSNPYFIEEVNKSKSLIYDRQSEEIFVFKNKMIRRAVERELL
jgi:predicted nucleotidyltransferase